MRIFFALWIQIISMIWKPLNEIAFGTWFPQLQANHCVHIYLTWVALRKGPSGANRNRMELGRNLHLDKSIISAKYYANAFGFTILCSNHSWRCEGEFPHIDFSLGFGSNSTSSMLYREAVVGDRLKRIVVYTVLMECRYVDDCWLVVVHSQSTTQGHGEDLYPQIYKYREMLHYPRINWSGCGEKNVIRSSQGMMVQNDTPDTHRTSSWQRRACSAQYPVMVIVIDMPLNMSQKYVLMLTSYAPRGITYVDNLKMK